MDRVEFLYTAARKFGKRISLAPLGYPGLNFTVDSASAGLLKDLTHEGQEDRNIAVLSYPLQAWLLPEHDDGPMTCPECEAILSGFLSCFTWSIQHGIGHCGSCKKVEFRYYHYVGNVCLRGWSIAGFTP